MAADKKKRRLHPQRPASVRQQDFQLGKVDGNIVDVDGIAIFIARAGKNRCPGMKHHRDAVGLSGAVDDLQFVHSCQISVGKQKLVRGMDFDHTDAQPQELFHVSHDVGSMARVQTAAGNQPLRILFRVIGDELIHA